MRKGKSSQGTEGISMLSFKMFVLRLLSPPKEQYYMHMWYVQYYVHMWYVGTQDIFTCMYLCHLLDFWVLQNW